MALRTRRPLTQDDEPYAYTDPEGPDGPVGPDPNDPNAPIPTAPTPTEPTTPPPTGEGSTPKPTLPGFVPPDPNAPTPMPRIIPDEEYKKQFTAPGADTGQWDTGGYAIPAFTSTTYNPNAVSGYDPAKWANPLHQTPKYVVGRILSGYNLNDPAQLQQAMADIARAYPGTTWGGRDTINIPGIGEVDVIRDFGGESGIAWQPAGAAAPPATTPLTPKVTTLPPNLGTGAGTPWAPGPAPIGPPPLPWTPPAPTTPPTTTPPPTTPPPDPTKPPVPTTNDLGDAARQAILKLLQQQPPTAESLRNSPENQAYQLQSQRGAERQRAELAERAGAEGFADTGYFETELGGINQQRAEGEAGFLGQVAVNRLQAQREDLQFAIAQAQQAGQFDLAQQLKEKEVALDAAIRREQIASTEKTAANELALKQFLGQAGIDLDRLRLDEESKQFLLDLAYRYGTLDEEGRQFDLNYATGPR